MIAALAAIVLVALPQGGAGGAQRADSLSERIRVREEVGGARLYERAALLGFYARRAFRSGWSNEQGPNRLADDLVNALGRADLDGLDPEEYHLARIRALLDTVRSNTAKGRPTDLTALADLDLLLSDAFLLYASHLLGGRVDPETLHPRWDANRRDADLGVVLEDALESRKVARALQRLVPTQEGYQRLREALARLRAIADAGGWPVIPPGVLKPGMQSPAVATLGVRLLQEGALVKAGGDVFDEPLEQAVRGFQRRHGLEETGIVDADTRAELNVSAAARVEQVRLNLERWRWLPQDLGRRRIIVNIAAQELQVIEDDEVVLGMRVVVGKDYKRTPIFSDTVRYIVLNPYWGVPQSIATEEMLPRIQKDSTYLERFGIHVYPTGPSAAEIDPSTVDWSKLTAEQFPYRLRQEPGRLNALGRIKFLFPNRYDVYLHDTPSRSLFERAQRDFSHGCIRVEQPIELAAYLMKKSRWDRDAIEEALDEGTEQTLYPPRPIPIHLLYWTAWADEDGTIEFRTDINAVDRPLAVALNTPLAPSIDIKKN